MVSWNRLFLRMNFNAKKGQGAFISMFRSTLFPPVLL